ncbi:Crp/Fnr family transcriptional regulator [Burkholderia multivorans]|nr:Crp/Fnr family transcriptional regulator [Burkholderia multivorans]
MATRAQVPATSLAGMEIFTGLPQAALRRVAASATMRRLAAQTRVFRQGDMPARAHVVIEGAVRILQTGSDGEQALMRFIVPGDMFGAVALFTDGRYPADAVTLVETLEVSWSESELLALTRRYPALGINALRIVGRRLQEVQNRVRELATQPAERRIAHALIRLARQGGRSTPDGTMIVFPLRRKDVADIAGTTLYTASRILTSWEKEGLLHNDRRYLTISEPGHLLRIAEDVCG